MNIKTACPLDCYDGCSVIATVDQDGSVQLQGNPAHPITRGALCNRGRRLVARRDSPDRILQPLKRSGESFQPISWAQAISEIAEQLRDTLVTDGHHAILHAYDWGSGAILKNLNQRFFYRLGGCTETVGSLCWEAGIEAQRYDFGQARSHAPGDMASHSAGIVVWGRNVATTNVHMMPFLKQAQTRGAKLVVINPLPTDVARRADFCLYPRPGTDAALALGALRICRDNGWLDEMFLSERSVGWTELSHTLDAFDLDTVADLTDIAADEVIRLASFYGQMRPVTTLLGLGMQRYAGGGNTIRAIDALVAATGHVGIPGGGVNYAQRSMPVFFDEESLTGRRQANVREFERGTQAQAILDATPAIRVLFVTRTNPAVQVPDSALLKQAYQSIRCKVVIDTFMTETAAMADYVLPCLNVLEEEDVTYTTMWHPYISAIRPVVSPRGDAKPEWQIFRDLATELGMADEMQGDVSSWLATVLKPLGEEARNELNREGFYKLPIDDVPWQDGCFLTPSGRFEFASSTAKVDGQSAVATCITSMSTQVKADAPYPYVLLTVHPRKHENSQREEMAPLDALPVVEVSADLAEARGIDDGAAVRVYNEKASIQAVARIRETGHTGTVKLESGWWGQGVTVNDFTHARMADFGSQTAQYDCLCNVEPLRDFSSSGAR